MRPLQSTQVDPPYRSICQLLQDQEQGAASSSSLQSVSLSSPPPDDGVTSQPQTQDDFTPAQTFLPQRFATDNGDLFATKPPSPITSNLPQATTKNLLNPQMFAGGGGSGSGGKSTPNAGLGGGGLIGGAVLAWSTPTSVSATTSGLLLLLCPSL